MAKKKKKKTWCMAVVQEGKVAAWGVCVEGERLGFVKKEGYFCLIKTYVLKFNLGSLMDSLINKGTHLTLKHNCL